MTRMEATLNPGTSAIRAGGDASKARIKTAWMRPLVDHTSGLLEQLFRFRRTAARKVLGWTHKFGRFGPDHPARLLYP
jgi:hypothetical protein